MPIAPLQIQGQALQTPAMVPLQRRSQYLADALEAIQRSTSEGIRSPAALGTNLLANAILMHGMRSNDRRMLEEAGRARQSVADIILSGLNGGQGQGQQSAPAPTQTQSMAPGAPPTMNQPQQQSSFLEARPGGSGGMYYVDEYPPGGPPEPSQAQQPPAPQMQPQQPQAGAAPYAGVPRGVVTPEERGMVEQLLRSGNPALFEQGMEMGQSLMQRQMAPVPLSPGHTYNQDGSVRDLEENWQSVPGSSPSDAAQRNTVTGRIEHQAIPGVEGPNGTFLTPQGYQMPPSVVNGQVLPYGAPTPDQMLSGVRGLLDSAPVANYRTLRTKAEPILLHPEDYANGAGDIALIETLQEALNGNPNLAVREGFVHTIAESPGWIATLEGQMRNAISRGESGFLLPDHRRRMVRLIEHAAAERYAAATAYVDEMRRGAAPLGYPAEAFPDIPPPPRATPRTPGSSASGSSAQAPPRVPAGMSPQQATQWARSQGLQSGDPIILPDGRQGTVP